MDKNEAPKISLRPLGSLFRDTWNLYKERWSVLVEIILLPTLATILGSVLMSLGSPFSIFGGLVMLAGWVIFIFSVLPVIYSVHNTAGVDASYKATIGLFWPFVWLVLLEAFAFFGGFIMLIIPDIWLTFAFSLAAYVFVIEHRRGIDALRQSKDYVKGYWWAVVGRVILLGVIFIAATLIIEVPITLVAGRVAGSAISMLLVLFFIPFSVIYHYIIFENLREIKPELAEVQTKEGTGFIKASAIVGVVAPILLFLLAIVFIGVAAFRVFGHAGRYAPSPGDHMRVPLQQ